MFGKNMKFLSAPQRPDRLRSTQPPIEWVPRVLSQTKKRPGREGPVPRPLLVEL
jgi:hypothetical protein